MTCTAADKIGRFKATNGLQPVAAEHRWITGGRTHFCFDGRIILVLDKDPEASALALSRTLGVARNTVHARLARLERSGALRSFSRRLDPAALGYDLMAFLSLSISQTRTGAVEDGLAAIPEVIEVHATTGDADLMAKVVARSTADLYRITNEILEIEGIQRTSTAISVLELMPPATTASWPGFPSRSPAHPFKVG
jgi:DNA-binding Lrp family transcriptional regulator